MAGTPTTALRHLQADCQEPGSAPEPYARQPTMDYLYLFTPILAWSDFADKPNDVHYAPPPQHAI